MYPKITITNSGPSSTTSAPTFNPFYAGFGNRPTDTKSYKAVGIPASRIFLINSTGDLKLDKLTFYTPYSASSYAKLTEEVDKVFPPLRSPQSLVRQAGDEAFTDFQYWTGGTTGSIRMDLVADLLKRSASNASNTSSASSSKSSQPPTLTLKTTEVIVPIPPGDGLSALAIEEKEDALLSEEAVLATAAGKVIISSPGRRRSESLSRMAKLKKLSFADAGGDADGESEAEELIDEESSEEDSNADEDEGTSVASITSYPFM